MPIIIKGSGGKSAELMSVSVIPKAYELTHYPNDGYDGFSEFTVQGDEDLIPENIKNGITIFGVLGTFSGAGGGYECAIVQADAQRDSNTTYISLSDSAVEILARHPEEYPEYMFIHKRGVTLMNPVYGILLVRAHQGEQETVITHYNGAINYKQKYDGLTLTRDLYGLLIESSGTSDDYKFTGMYDVFLLYPTK